MRPHLIRSVLLCAAIAALAAPAAALDEIVAARGWDQVDYVEDGACRAEVRGNGRFYRIAGAGFRAGDVVSFHLENEGIKPVEYRIVVADDGGWRQFYVPFLWHRSGGRVTVALDGAGCSLDLAFDWRRQSA
jgi:hypothetical protein